MLPNRKTIIRLLSDKHYGRTVIYWKRKSKKTQERIRRIKSSCKNGLYIEIQYIIKMDKILIVLDIDGTLLHASFESEQYISTYKLHYRPGLLEFIKLIQTHFEVAIWTAGSDDYAKFVCDRLFDNLDPPLFIWSHKRCTIRYVQTGLTISKAYIIKKLSKIKWNINRILIVDNTPSTYMLNYGNAIPISTWKLDYNDDALDKLGMYLTETFNKFDGSVRYIHKMFWET
jgi:hypothetical protein